MSSLYGQQRRHNIWMFPLDSQMSKPIPQNPKMDTDLSESWRKEPTITQVGTGMNEGTKWYNRYKKGAGQQKPTSFTPDTQDEKESPQVPRATAKPKKMLNLNTRDDDDLQLDYSSGLIDGEPENDLALPPSEKMILALLSK